MRGRRIDSLLTINKTGMPEAPNLTQLLDKDVKLLYLRDKSKNSAYFINIKDVLDNSFQGPLSWLKSDPKKVSVTITGLPKREEAEADINEQLIVEYYSR